MTLDDAYRYAAERVDYDPETGALTWKQREGDDPVTKRWNARHAGKEAGSTNSEGYLAIHVRLGGQKQRVLLAHRLVWLIAHGAMPDGEIDHADGARSNNRLANLRVVTRQQNSRNCGLHRANTSGVTGVSWDSARQRWVARIMVDGRYRTLGRYVNKEDAVAVAQRARLNLGFTPRHCGLTENA